LKPKRELDIHEIIKNYPYFLGHELAVMRLVHERIYPDRTRADFTFSDEKKIFVVEVKKSIISTEMLAQVLSYMDNERRQNTGKTVEGILVGLPSKNKKLEMEIQDCEYLISEKFIGVDVPSDARQIKICANCRRANWQHRRFCEYCGSSDHIKDPFMFGNGI